MSYHLIRREPEQSLYDKLMNGLKHMSSPAVTAKQMYIHTHIEPYKPDELHTFTQVGMKLYID